MYALDVRRQPAETNYSELNAYFCGYRQLSCEQQQEIRHFVPLLNQAKRPILSDSENQSILSMAAAVGRPPREILSDLRHAFAKDCRSSFVDNTIQLERLASCVQGIDADILACPKGDLAQRETLLLERHELEQSCETLLSYNNNILHLVQRHAPREQISAADRADYQDIRAKLNTLLFLEEERGKNKAYAEQLYGGDHALMEQIWTCPYLSQKALHHILEDHRKEQQQQKTEQYLMDHYDDLGAINLDLKVKVSEAQKEGFDQTIRDQLVHEFLDVFAEYEHCIEYLNAHGTPRQREVWQAKFDVLEEEFKHYHALLYLDRESVYAQKICASSVEQCLAYLKKRIKAMEIVMSSDMRHDKKIDRLSTLRSDFEHQLYCFNGLKPTFSEGQKDQMMKIHEEMKGLTDRFFQTCFSY